MFEDKFAEFTDKTSSEWSRRISGNYLSPIIIFLDTFALDDSIYMNDTIENKMLEMLQNIRSEIIIEEINS